MWAGAALDADEVIIWTDVDGLLTADPRVVSGARTIPEIAYHEAAELAYFGARVLHRKTLRAVTQRGIPVWIRNTFAPEQPGTKITRSGPPCRDGVKALTSMSDVAMITIASASGAPDVLGRTLATTSAIGADVLLISPSQNGICLVVSSSLAQRTLDALCREFEEDLAQESVSNITIDSTVAIVTLVGQSMRTTVGIIARAYSALGRENVNIIASAQGSSESNISFVVAHEDLKSALVTLHREFQLGTLNSQMLAIPGNRPATWFCSSEPTADSA